MPSAVTFLRGMPLYAFVLAHRIAPHFDAVGIVNQPVEDTVGQPPVLRLSI